MNPKHQRLSRQSGGQGLALPTCVPKDGGWKYCFVTRKPEYELSHLLGTLPVLNSEPQGYYSWCFAWKNDHIALCMLLDKLARLLLIHESLPHHPHYPSNHAVMI
jgi:hypothetical protein